MVIFGSIISLKTIHTCCHDATFRIYIIKRNKFCHDAKKQWWISVLSWCWAEMTIGNPIRACLVNKFSLGTWQSLSQQIDEALHSWIQGKIVDRSYDFLLCSDNVVELPGIVGDPIFIGRFKAEMPQTAKILHPWSLHHELLLCRYNEWGPISLRGYIMLKMVCLALCEKRKI